MHNSNELAEIRYIAEDQFLRFSRNNYFFLNTENLEYDVYYLLEEILVEGLNAEEIDEIQEMITEYLAGLVELLNSWISKSSVLRDLVKCNFRLEKSSEYLLVKRGEIEIQFSMFNLHIREDDRINLLIDLPSYKNIMIFNN